MSTEIIESGTPFDWGENSNYQVTHYRAHWLGEGNIQAEAVCINEYGSCYGTGAGFNLSDQPNPGWDMDWTDISI